MHHHNDLGSKCAYTCHLSNKTTRKSVLLSTPQIWLMKVSKKTGLSIDSNNVLNWTTSRYQMLVCDTWKRIFEKKNLFQNSTPSISTPKETVD